MSAWTSLIFELSATIVDVAIFGTVFQFLEFLVRCDSRPAQSTGNHPCESELLVLYPYCIVVGQFILDSVVEVSGYDRIMFTGIPFATTFRVLKLPIVESIFKNDIDVTQC